MQRAADLELWKALVHALVDDQSDEIWRKSYRRQPRASSFERQSTTVMNAPLHLVSQRLKIATTAASCAV